MNGKPTGNDNHVDAIVQILVQSERISSPKLLRVMQTSVVIKYRQGIRFIFEKAIAIPGQTDGVGVCVEALNIFIGIV